MMTRYDLMAGERDCSKSISLHRILDWMDKNISLDIFAVCRLRKGVGTIDMDDRILKLCMIRQPEATMRSFGAIYGAT